MKNQGKVGVLLEKQTELRHMYTEIISCVGDKTALEAEQLSSDCKDVLDKVREINQQLDNHMWFVGFTVGGQAVFQTGMVFMTKYELELDECPF